MQAPARHPQEVARLQALRESRLLDTASEDLFDEIVNLAARVCSVPTALISLVDRDRQWFKAKTGLDGVSETARDISFCGHAILGENLFEVVDARQDERFADNPLVTGEPGVRFYAAHPVVDRQSGLPIGTLCVLDSRPRRLEVHQRAMLVHLAALAEGIIDARRQVISLTDRLAQQEARYRRLYTDTPAMLHSLDANGHLVSVSNQWLAATGFRHEEVIGRGIWEFFTPESRRIVDQSVPGQLESGECQDAEMQMVTRDGTVLDVLLSSIVERDDEGNVVRSLASIHDVTRRRRAEFALAREKQRMEVTLSSIADAVLTTNEEGLVEYLNPVAERMTGWRTAEASGRPLGEVFDIVHELTREPAPNPISRCLADGAVHHIPEGTVLLSRTGEQFHIADSAAPIRDSLGQLFGAVLVFHDITEQRRMQRDLIRQAQEDPLTGLPNRREFEERVKRAVETARSRDVTHALLYLDLDQFKLVNDSCGHPAGDELLCQIARLFSGQLRQRDTIARLGGDEFGVLLENCPMDTARRLAEKLRAVVDEYRFVHEERRFQIGVSIGISSIAADSESVSEALRAADSALYAAKEGGRNRVHVFRPHDEALARRHGEMRWVNRIQEAIESDRFVLMAQPILAVTDPVAPGRRIEVLLRLQDEGKRLVAPSGFMPAAERYHQAVAIDRWVVENTLRTLAVNQDAVGAMEYCAINLSGQSLGDRMFHAFVSRMLERYDVPPQRLCFEVTETAAIANLADAKRFMQTLNAQGCHFSLDDFGSGLSSFGYLRELPVRSVKIDARFVRDVADDPIDLAMVRSIAEVARLMGKATVAEGIENPAVLREIRELGIDFGQGFVLAAPSPLAGVLGEIANLGPIPSRLSARC